MIQPATEEPEPAGVHPSEEQPLAPVPAFQPYRICLNVFQPGKIANGLGHRTIPENVQQQEIRVYPRHIIRHAGEIQPISATPALLMEATDIFEIIRHVRGTVRALLLVDD